MLATWQIQGYTVSGLAAVYQVVEHFGLHYGQIVYITKMQEGRDLGFYKELNQDRPRPRWVVSVAEFCYCRCWIWVSGRDLDGELVCRQLLVLINLLYGQTMVMPSSGRLITTCVGNLLSPKFL